MGIIRKFLVSTLLGSMVVVMAPGVARADDDVPSSWAVDRYETTVTFDQSGTGKATTRIDFDFASDAGHGPFVYFVTRMRVPGDDDHWRRIDIDVTNVTPPTGAPADLKTSSESGLLKLRIGSERRKVSGVQSYLVDYTIHGVVDPANATSNLDEVNWNVVGSGWQVPIRAAKATITLPATPSRTSCFSGKKYTTPCTASASGRTVTYTAGPLAKEQGVQVVAGAPIGTFVGAEPRLS